MSAGLLADRCRRSLRKSQFSHEATGRDDKDCDKEKSQEERLHATSFCSSVSLANELGGLGVQQWHWWMRINGGSH